MPDTTDHVRKLIEDLEAEERRVREALDGARELLRKLAPESEDEQRTTVTRSEPKPEPGTDQPEPFTRKYDESAKTLVMRALETEFRGRGAALPEIKRYLEDDGKEFHRETINASLRQMLKAGEVERVRAGKDSPYKWIYRPAGKESPESRSLARPWAARQSLPAN